MWSRCSNCFHHCSAAVMHICSRECTLLLVVGSWRLLSCLTPVIRWQRLMCDMMNRRSMWCLEEVVSLLLSRRQRDMNLGEMEQRTYPGIAFSVPSSCPPTQVTVMLFVGICKVRQLNQQSKNQMASLFWGMWVHKGRQSLCLVSRTPAHLWMKWAVKWTVISVTIHLAVMEMCYACIWCNTPILFWVAPYTGSCYGSRSFTWCHHLNHKNRVDSAEAHSQLNRCSQCPFHSIGWHWEDIWEPSSATLSSWGDRRMTQGMTVERSNLILRLSCHVLNLSVVGTKTSFVVPVRFLYSLPFC